MFPKKLNSVEDVLSRMAKYLSVLEESYVGELDVRKNAKTMEEIEDRNFSSWYAASAGSLIRDSRMEDFIGYGIFDDSGKIHGYAYGYKFGADGEYDDLEDLDLEELKFHDEDFKNAILNADDILNILPEGSAFYFSNLVVDRKARLKVNELISNVLKTVKSHGYTYICFDGLKDTMNLFSGGKISRLANNNLKLLATYEDGGSVMSIMKFLN